MRSLQSPVPGLQDHPHICWLTRFAVVRRPLCSWLHTQSARNKDGTSNQGKTWGTIHRPPSSLPAGAIQTTILSPAVKCSNTQVVCWTRTVCLRLRLQSCYSGLVTEAQGLVTTIKTTDFQKEKIQLLMTPGRQNILMNTRKILKPGLQMPEEGQPTLITPTPTRPF